MRARAIIALHSFNISGVLTQSLICAKYLSTKGYEVLVVGREGRHGESLFRREGIKTFVQQSRSLHQALKETRDNASIVICESIFAEGVFTPLARALPRATKVLRVHEEVSNDLLERGLWQYSVRRDFGEIFSEFALVICPSEHTKAFYEPVARRLNHLQRWLVIPNTVNEEMTGGNGELCKRFRVLQLGTVSQRKNPLLTLIAFEIFLQSHKPTNAELVFVGYRNANNRERECLTSLRREIRARRLVPYVKVRPTHLIPSKDLFEASAVTLHSSSECSPTVFLEAGFFGKTVIGPNVGGIAEIVAENVNGHLFDYGNCAEQAKLIGSLYEQRDSLPAKIPSIKEHYYSHFSNRLFFERMDTAFEDLHLAND